MFENLNVVTLSDDEMWTLREAALFYITTAAERERAGVDPPGTLRAAQDLAHALGVTPGPSTGAQC